MVNPDRALHELIIVSERWLVERIFINPLTETPGNHICVAPVAPSIVHTNFGNKHRGPHSVRAAVRIMIANFPRSSDEIEHLVAARAQPPLRDGLNFVVAGSRSPDIVMHASYAHSSLSSLRTTAATRLGFIYQLASATGIHAGPRHESMTADMFAG